MADEAKVVAQDHSEALERGLAILESFRGVTDGLTQAQLAKDLGLPRATVRRAVLTLERMGYLEAHGRQYFLRPTVMSLAATFLSANPFVDVLQPACDRLCEAFNTSSSFGMLDGSEVVLVVRAVPRSPLHIGRGVGIRIPLEQSALGQILIACEPSVSDARLPSKNVERIQKDGFAYVADAVEKGFHSVAVPVHKWDGELVGALNIGGYSSAISRGELLGDALSQLRVESKAVANQLI